MNIKKMFYYSKSIKKYMRPRKIEKMRHIAVYFTDLEYQRIKKMSNSHAMHVSPYLRKIILSLVDFDNKGDPTISV